jgi:hypothetical protein
LPFAQKQNANPEAGSAEEIDSLKRQVSEMQKRLDRMGSRPGDKE